MAPSKDGNNKYGNLSLEKLKNECVKRKLDITDANTSDDYIKLLLNDDNSTPDWGRIYCRVLYHTGIGYEEISRRTIPQIMAILEGAGENISTMGLPFYSASQVEETPQEVDNETKLSQVDQIERMFNR